MKRYVIREIKIFEEIDGLKKGQVKNYVEKCDLLCGLYDSCWMDDRKPPVRHAACRAAEIEIDEEKVAAATALITVVDSQFEARKRKVIEREAIRFTRYFLAIAKAAGITEMEE